jgi:benzaldehyde dehydrogenase (NAD)
MRRTAVGSVQRAWHEAVFVGEAFGRPAAGGTIDVRDRASGEIFAPIAPVLVVDGDDEAVAVTNDTPYGLVNSVLAGDTYRGIEVARRLRAGMVHVNDARPQDEALAPFGGMGQSGLGGRSGGDSNIEEFTQRRWLTVNPGPAHYPY